MIVTGEASGDLHGSKVSRAIRQQNAEVEVYAVGSKHMRQAGAEILVDSSQLAVVGITEVMERFGSLIKAYWNLKNFIRKSGINLLILIDFPDFNLMLAKVARRLGVPILYYISPQIWAWRPGRLQKIARLVNKMAVIFPFEVPIYQKAGLSVQFVGHPLLDVLGSKHWTDSFRDNFEFNGGPLIALLPGSREREIKYLLPEMVRGAQILLRQKPEAKFILAAAPTINIQGLKKILATQPVDITVVEGQTYQAIMAADLVIVASGTATLETAILGKPMVIVYRVSSLSYWVGKVMVKVGSVGLVNIVAGKNVVPELLQGEAKGERIAAEALKILDDEAYRMEMLRRLAEVREKLGTPGAAERVAKTALEMIREKKAVSDQLSAE